MKHLHGVAYTVCALIASAAGVVMAIWTENPAWLTPVVSLLPLAQPREETPMQSLLSMREVTTRFPVSRRTVERWIAAGKLRKIQPGGPHTKILFDPKDVEALARGVK